MHHTDVGSTSLLQVFIHMRHKLPVRHRKCRSVDELSTFYIFRWVSNDFHILLKYMHNSVMFGPVFVGKGYPTFHNLWYDKICPKCNAILTIVMLIVKIYVAKQITWKCLPVMVMFTCCFIFCQCLLNVWWRVTYKHPSEQCPTCISTNLSLTAWYPIDDWNYITSSCRKTHDPYIRLKKHLT